MTIASAKPVFQKLGLKPKHRAMVLNQPEDVVLGNLPAGVQLQKQLDGQFDFILTFCVTLADLVKQLPQLKKFMTKSGMLWVCWKKGNVTDMGRDSIGPVVDSIGLEGVSLVSINSTWSSFKLMYPKSDRI